MSNVINIFHKDITYNKDTRCFLVKTGFRKKEIQLEDVIDFGVRYGMGDFNMESVLKARDKGIDFEKYLTGKRDNDEIKSVMIFFLHGNNKLLLHPLSIATQKKGRTLIVAEEILDTINEIITGERNG